MTIKTYLLCRYNYITILDRPLKLLGKCPLCLYTHWSASTGVVRSTPLSLCHRKLSRPALRLSILGCPAVIDDRHTEQ